MEDNNNNVINNYKGVMLCSRPNENKPGPIEKPFCGRVVPGQQIGLNPTKKEGFQPQKPKKVRNSVLEKHKKWLEQFKANIGKSKQEIEKSKAEEQEKKRKIREQAEADRQRARKMKEEYNQTAANVMNVLDDKPAPRASNELTAQNLKRLNDQNQKKQAQAQPFKKKSKNQKPLWALTKDQYQKKQDDEVDDLINFFETNPVKEYSEDDQVKEILKNLKEKIEKMRQQQNWKEKEAERIQQKRQERQRRRQNGIEDDKYSTFSVSPSQGKSVASERTQKKIEQLRAKKAQQQEWDKHTASQKSSIADIEERIAKNLADEVLRNYPNMRGVHSNTSIRKLLEAEAAKVLSQPIVRPVITTIVKEKQSMNANTLPYLHRNPAL